uniref:Transposase n=1 Tax=Ascaris lumbricoides TaxID=6252 RepID=A0A0M3IFQ0_ASCLU
KIIDNIIISSCARQKSADYLFLFRRGHFQQNATYLKDPRDEILIANKPINKRRSARIGVAIPEVRLV